jgi:hypothetical protein
MNATHHGRQISPRISRIIHACWITALIIFVATPDGEGASKGVGARQVASWIAGH